jgi:hypothetical protein
MGVPSQSRCARQLPQRGSQGGTAGDGRFVGQGLCPCLSRARGVARVEPLPYGAERPRKRAEDWGLVAPSEQPLWLCGAISPFRGDKGIRCGGEPSQSRCARQLPQRGSQGETTGAGDSEPASNSPASPERGGARRSGRRGSPAGHPPSPAGLGSPLGGAVPRSGTERATPPQRAPPVPPQGTPVPRRTWLPPWGSCPAKRD